MFKKVNMIKVALRLQRYSLFSLGMLFSEQRLKKSLVLKG